VNRVSRAAVGLIFLTGAAVFAQAPAPVVELSLEDILARVAAENLELARSAVRIERARIDLAGDPWYQDSRVTLGAGYDRGPDSRGNGTTEEWSGRAGVTVPVVPQLSAGAGLTATEGQDLEQELSLTLTPFEAGRTTYLEERALRGALVTRRYLLAELALEAEEAAFSLLVGRLDRELAQRNLALEEETYRIALRRQEIGEASFLDVQEQQSDLIDARRALFETEQRLAQAVNRLQLLVSPGGERLLPRPEELRRLEALVEARAAALTEAAEGERGAPSTEGLELAELDLARLEAELSVTRRWSPELDLSASHSFPDNATGVDLSLTFTPDQVALRDIRELQGDIELARLTVAAERYGAQLDRELGEQSIGIARQALEAARLQEEQDRTALDEGELLYAQGGRTTVQLEQLRLNVLRAEIDRYEAAIDLYRLLGEQLLLFESSDSGV